MNDDIANLLMEYMSTRSWYIWLQHMLKEKIIECFKKYDVNNELQKINVLILGMDGCNGWGDKNIIIQVNYKGIYDLDYEKICDELGMDYQLKVFYIGATVGEVWGTVFTYRTKER